MQIKPKYLENFGFFDGFGNLERFSKIMWILMLEHQIAMAHILFRWAVKCWILL